MTYTATLLLFFLIVAAVLLSAVSNLIGGLL